MTIACLSTNSTNHFVSEKAVTTLFIATTNGVVRAERDADGQWTSTAAGLEGSHVAALVHDASSGLLYAAQMPGTVMASADGGCSWSMRSTGIKEGGAYSLRCYPREEGSTLYVGTQPVGLYRSIDGGENWDDLASVRTAPLHDTWRFPAPGHEPHLKTLAVDPRDSDVLYAGVEQGALLKSTDGGRTWSDLDEFVDYDNFVYKDIHQVLLRPSNPDHIYITTGLGIFHSGNGGQNWEQLTNSEFRIGYPDQLLFAPGNDQHMIVSGGFAIPFYWVESRSAKGTVRISDDGGRTWHEPAGGFPEGKANVEAMSICAHDGGYEIFAGTTDGEVLHSVDGGENWAVIIRGIAPVSKPTHDTLIAGEAYKGAPEPTEV